MLATHPTAGATTRRGTSHARFKFPRNPGLFPSRRMNGIRRSEISGEKAREKRDIVERVQGRKHAWDVKSGMESEISEGIPESFCK